MATLAFRAHDRRDITGEAAHLAARRSTTAATAHDFRSSASDRGPSASRHPAAPYGNAVAARARLAEASGSVRDPPHRLRDLTHTSGYQHERDERNSKCRPFHCITSGTAG